MDGAGTEMQLSFCVLGSQGKGMPFDHRHNLKLPVLHGFIHATVYNIH